MSMEPRYFEDAAALRRWFAQHAATADELVVGFMKTATGAASVSWPEAVDEALCVGWIDGVRHRVDDARYRIRFAPRTADSNWSAVNIARVAALEAEGRMTAAGLAAFARRTEAKSRTASYEQAEPVAFGPAEIARFRAVPDAWAFFDALPAGYRKKLTWWVLGAKQQATRDRRLQQFIDACAAGQRL